MEKTVSIVIPVYNKERYIRNCIDSLIELNINKEETEAIFVDDLSSDASLEILKEYEEKHEFIRVIALDENSGTPSRPRNIGIAEAKGTYVTFLDADDWLDSEGFPEVIEQMKENDADIGFAQVFRHTDKGIIKHGRFSSYKDENNLIPFEIENIFRAVGPQGKVFKRSAVIDNDIKFKHMKFGEDKLFFIELISKCKNALMSTLPFHHFNRYQENVSLVKETTVLDKAGLNLEVLKQILQLDIPEAAKEQALSRMVEMDFFLRFFHTRTFLKSLEKDKFYRIFEQAKQMLQEVGYDIEDFITLPKFKNIHHLYENGSKDELAEYIECLISDGKNSKFINDNVVQKRFPDKFNDLEPVTEECYPVYQGTHMIGGELHEVIHLYKEPEVRIERVLLSKISDERVEKKIDYQLKDDKIYIRTEDLLFEGVNINLRVTFDKSKSAPVRESSPNGSDHYLLKRQGYKAAFTEVLKGSMVPAGDYISVLPESVVALKGIYSYADEDFKAPNTDKIPAGTRFNISDITYSSRGTPRLKTEEGRIITANRKYVKELDVSKIDGYITEAPIKVKITNKCKLYDSRTFKGDPLKILEPGEELSADHIIYTNNLTPRLKTEENTYFTANMEYVEVITDS
ncbi:glycosyltransferase [Salinicoccus sp. HZC-1]|uniref:glycosyltransferase n=1 Tax=Salinicoccus sp. HZC-1 TaxID=3385497 RepID=UPI00398A628F